VVSRPQYIMSTYVVEAIIPGNSDGPHGHVGKEHDGMDFSHVHAHVEHVGKRAMESWSGCLGWVGLGVDRSERQVRM